MVCDENAAPEIQGQRQGQSVCRRRLRTGGEEACVAFYEGLRLARVHRFGQQPLKGCDNPLGDLTVRKTTTMRTTMFFLYEQQRRRHYSTH